MKKALLKIFTIIAALIFTCTNGFAVDAKSPVKPAPPVKPTVTRPGVKKEAKKELVNLNTATASQLKTLPGISDAYALKIINGRPYARKDQLKFKKVIPDTAYEKIKDMIIASQLAKEPKKK